jgi:hypothetical protein
MKTESSNCDPTVPAESNRENRLPPLQVKLKTWKGKTSILSADDEKDFPTRKRELFGTESQAFADRQVIVLGSLTLNSGGTPSESALNAMLAAVHAVHPDDEIEAQLAVQMAATHQLAMLMMYRLAQAGGRVAEAEEYATISTKLLRTWTMQAEALARLRRGGEQRVVVEHVTVNEGGQAIVGSVNQGGGQRGRR